MVHSVLSYHYLSNLGTTVFLQNNKFDEENIVRAKKKN